MNSEQQQQHKAGFVNILGKPNVGKSTIMNSLVGEKLSIITSKAQTTRHRIQGIVNGDNFQVIFSDTPGLLNPHYKLQEHMLNSALSTLEDADVIMLVVDVNEDKAIDEVVLKKMQESEASIIVVLNKIDLSNQQEVEKQHNNWEKILPDTIVLPLSAKKGFNISTLFELILKMLPDSPPYYPKDEMTDKSERFFAGEMIREKVLMNYRQEIPYSVEIEIEKFKEEKRLIRISAIIYVERDSQKGIIIGKQGAALKKTGQEARTEMEAFFGKKVFLELFVKVRKDWRNNERMLRGFGYR